MQPGQPVRNDKPLQLFDAENAKKGQNPLKRVSPEKKSIQARDSNLCAKEKSRQKILRDKNKSPQPNKTLNANLNQFQIKNTLELPTPKPKLTTTKASMKAVTASNTISMEELPTNTKAVRNEKEAATTPTTKKRVTTIFVMRKQAKYKVPMAKKPVKKVQEVPKPEETNSSDEELIAAAQALEENQEAGRKDEEGEASSMAGIDVTVDMPHYLPSSENDSDEELLLATLELEHLQLANHNQGEPALEAHHQ